MLEHLIFCSGCDIQGSKVKNVMYFGRHTLENVVIGDIFLDTFI